MLKKLFASILTISLLSNSVCVYADTDFDHMNDNQKAQAVGVYVEEIIKYINDNYIGDKEVTVEELMHAAIKAMTGELDAYSDYLTPEEYNEIKNAETAVWYSPDFECSFNEDGYPKVTEITPSSRAYQAGLRKGNTIKAIDDVSTYGIGEEEYNSVVTKAEATPIRMKVSSSDSVVTEIKIPVTPRKVPTVMTYDIDKAGLGSENIKFDDESVAYIKIESFSNKTSDEFEKIMNEQLQQGKTKLILDLRSNTGGYVDEAIKIAQMIVPQGLIISTKDKSGNGINYTSSLKSTPFSKYVVLVNSITASASEILASAMQDSGIATIVGEKTYGKGVMQSVMDFGDAGVIKTTTQEYTTRNGNKVNGVGITPDVTVDKVLFVSEDDTVDSPKVAMALQFLGFRIDERNSVSKAIGSYQAEMKIPITYQLNKETINAINLEIYEDMIKNDRILTAGYINILS